MTDIVFKCGNSELNTYNIIVSTVFTFLSSRDNIAKLIKEPYICVNDTSNIVISTILVSSITLTAELCNEFMQRFGLECYNIGYMLCIYDKYIIRIIHPDTIKNYQLKHYFYCSCKKPDSIKLTIKSGDVTRETISMMKIYHELGIPILDINSNEPKFTVDSHYRIYNLDSLPMSHTYDSEIRLVNVTINM